MTVEKAIAEIERHLPSLDKKNTSVSASSVAWHLNHNLNVIHTICSGLKISDPNAFQPKFSLSKLLIMTTTFIPRGKARAPKATSKPDNFTREDLEKQLEKVKEDLSSIQGLPKNSFIDHPFFGNLNLKESIRFMGIHSKHHLKIVEDILK